MTSLNPTRSMPAQAEIGSEGRRVLLVAGMHRSGTSVLTQALGLLGAGLPNEPLIANDDNPGGYWESAAVVRLNNEMLLAAGLPWFRDDPLDARWFADPERVAFRERIKEVLLTEFPKSPVIVVKDPRLCRLLPIWGQAIDELGWRMSVIMIVRDPSEVAASLRARSQDERFMAAAIVDGMRARSLWLRYVLDAELHSKSLDRLWVDYASLVADWRTAVSVGDLGLAEPESDVAAAVDRLFSRGRPANVSGEQQVGSTADAFHHALSAAIVSGTETDAVAACDSIRATWDRIGADLGRMTALIPIQAESNPWSEASMRQLRWVVDLGEPPPPAAASRVLFVSHAPTSVGHVYRVARPVQALTELGWQARWIASDASDLLSSAREAEVVVASRWPWDEALEAVREETARRGSLLVFDIDDLVFDRSIMEAGALALLDHMTAEQRASWFGLADRYARSLAACDAAVLSTEPLADAAGALCTRTLTLRNHLGPALRPVSGSDRLGHQVILGYASGTATHHRDFAVAAPALAHVLSEHPDVVVRIIGHIDPSQYPELRSFESRVEVRPAVPFTRLADEIAGFDINLAPLELGNRFCAAKSAVRINLAAAVSVPSVASATQPAVEAVVNGWTGVLAVDDAWHTHLAELVADRGAVAEMGRLARIHVQACFGWSAYLDSVGRAFGGLAANR